MNSIDIFDRLQQVFSVGTLKELSETLGFKANWATSTRTRNGIPFEACAIAVEKFGVSMDYMLFGSQANVVRLVELKASITEGIFAAVQTNMITLNSDVKISTLSNMITSEVIDGCNIKVDEALSPQKAI